MSGLLRPLLLALLLALGSSPTALRAEMMILLSSRSGWVDFIDPNTLQVKGRLPAGDMTDSVVARPDGKMLFVTKPRPSEPQGCCARYAIDLMQKSETQMLWPAGAPVMGPTGDRMFLQRGNVGVDVFDARTLKRMPTICAPGVYRLFPSPDRRWLFGTNTFHESTVDVFDLQTLLMIWRISVPTEGTLGGAWLADSFYLFSYDRGQGRLWRLSSETIELDAGTPVALPGNERSEIALWNLVAAHGHLFLYEIFGTKFDNRSTSATSPAGGVYQIDPANGGVIRSLIPELHFSAVRFAPNTSEVYGIDVASETWEGICLVKFDEISGRILAVHELDSAFWNIALADIPSDLIPHQPSAFH